jgi:membrane fusion protein (multidrug efflux system)
MKKIKPFIRLTLVIVIMAGLFISCGKNNENQQAAQEQVLAVKAVLVKKTSQDIIKVYTGSLEGEKQADIYSKLAETVEKIHVRENQPVTVNQVLISLDRFGPSTRYNETRSLFLNSEKNYNKLEFLFNEGAISESQYDAARTDYEVTKANFEAVKKLVDIEAPITGVVTAIDVSEGNFVSIGQKLATVATVGKLRVKFGVNSEEVKSFKKDMDVTISSTELNYRAPGKVTAVASSADPQTRSFQIEAIFDNTDGHFKPGMFVRVSLVLNRLEGVLLIPHRAILMLDNNPTVFVAHDNIVSPKVLTLGQEVDGKVVVTDGLVENDTLITLGQDYLENGNRVKITTWEE